MALFSILRDINSTTTDNFLIKMSFPFHPSPLLSEFAETSEQVESGVLVGLAVLFLIAIIDLGFASYGRHRVASKLVNVWLSALYISTSLGIMVRVFPKDFECGQLRYSMSAGMFGLGCMLLFIALRLHRMIQDLRITVILFVCFAIEVGSIIWQSATISVSLAEDGTCASRIDPIASVFQASVFLFCNILTLSFIIYARVVIVKMKGELSRSHTREISCILLPFSILQVVVIAGWFFTATKSLSGAFTFSLLAAAYANTNIALFFIDKFQLADHKYVEKDVEEKSFNNRKSVGQSMRSFFQPTEAYPDNNLSYYQSQSTVRQSMPVRDDYSRKDQVDRDDRDSFIHDDMSNYDEANNYLDSRYTAEMVDAVPRQTYEYSEYTAARDRA